MIENMSSKDRIERLVIVWQLRERSAREIHEELERRAITVSRRTVERDLEAVRQIPLVKKLSEILS